jgi:hypothetical protein
MMRGDGGIHEIAPKPSETGQCAIFVGPGKAAVSTTSAARIAASFRVSVMTFRHNPYRNDRSLPAECGGRYHASILSSVAQFTRGPATGECLSSPVRRASSCVSRFGRRAVGRTNMSGIGEKRK